MINLNIEYKTEKQELLLMNVYGTSSNRNMSLFNQNKFKNVKDAFNFFRESWEIQEIDVIKIIVIETLEECVFRKITKDLWLRINL